MKSIRIRAYAKINLSLDVIRRREDGYHDIESLMQSVSMFDEMFVACEGLPSDVDLAGYNGLDVDILGVNISLYMNSEALPPSGDNLAIKGARRLIETLLTKGCELPEKIAIIIDKRLPIAAGIAGGSGNAAGAMLGLNAVLGYPLSLEALMETGSKVGADVPFSLQMNAAMNRAAMDGLKGLESASLAADISGIGELVKPVEPIERTVLIVNPGIAVSTKEVYEAIDALPEESRRPQGLWHNMMEGYTLDAYPEAKELKDTMTSLNADCVLMSGSGPTMVAYYTAEETANIDLWTLKEIIGQSGKPWRVWLTETGKEPKDVGFSVKGAETS